MKRTTTHNRTYPKVAVKWLNFENVLFFGGLTHKELAHQRGRPKQKKHPHFCECF